MRSNYDILSSSQTMKKSNRKMRKKNTTTLNDIDRLPFEIYANINDLRPLSASAFFVNIDHNLTCMMD